MSAQPHCPVCKRALALDADAALRPFCSRRCKDVDLGRWLTGSYAIPVVEDEDEDGEAPGTGARETMSGQGPHEGGKPH